MIAMGRGKILNVVTSYFNLLTERKRENAPASVLPFGCVRVRFSVAGCARPSSAGQNSSVAVADATLDEQRVLLPASPPGVPEAQAAMGVWFQGELRGSAPDDCRVW